MSEHNQIDESSIIQHSQEWLNDHGQPSYSHLKKLMESNDPADKDELLELAERYNISYDRSTTLNELVEKIRMFMGMGSDSA